MNTKRLKELQDELNKLKEKEQYILNEIYHEIQKIKLLKKDLKEK
jgi:hypothetical protein